MGSSNIVQNLMSGDMLNANRGIDKVGMPVLNNQGTPSSGKPVVSPIVGAIPNAPNPLQPGGTISEGALIPPTPNPMFPTMTQSSGGFHSTLGGIPVQQAYASTSGNGSGNLLPTNATPTASTPTGSTGSTDAPYSNLTPQQQQELQKQLVDIFGKGEGNLLDSLIGSIGSNDDAYMQAYIQAMQGPNAENLATLNTTLGNSGIGANSSTAAIANADFQSNITAQEGLQEQQLKMNDLQQLMSLTEGLQGQSAKEVSSGGIGSILGGIIGAIPGLSGVGQAIAEIGNTGGQAVQSAGTIAQASQPATIPTVQTDTSSLPDLSEELQNSDDILDLIGAGVEI